MTVIHVTDKEFHTILAALRYYQSHGQGDGYNRAPWIQEIASNAGEIPRPLDDAGINELCERINSEYELINGQEIEIEA